jgi:hypothetical protein
MNQMSRMRDNFAIAIALCVFTAATAAAQEGVLPPPDSSYGGGPTAYQAPTDLPMPAPDDMTNPNVVTIPIPGGGEITVDGPDAPSDKPLPTLPGSQWGNETQNPFLHGAGPMGP